MLIHFNITFVFLKFALLCILMENNPIFDTGIYVCPYSSVCKAQTAPPWILKQVGLESSGQIIISSNGKTKRIATTTKNCNFFFLSKFSIFLNKKSAKTCQNKLRRQQGTLIKEEVSCRCLERNLPNYSSMGRDALPKIIKPGHGFL